MDAYNRNDHLIIISGIQLTKAKTRLLSDTYYQNIPTSYTNQIIYTEKGDKISIVENSWISNLIINS